MAPGFLIRCSVVQLLEWTLVNSSVALVGHYFAAITVDNPMDGPQAYAKHGLYVNVCTVHLLCNWLHKIDGAR